MKKLIRLFITDAPLGGYRLRDARLSAVPVGKVIVSGTVWAGSLKPLIDAGAATFGPLLDTPFAAGRTLHANELSGVIDVGRAWVGNLASEIRSAAANSSGGPTVDVGETLAEAERLDELLRSAAPTNVITDNLRRLRRAADRVGVTRTGDATGKFGHITSASIKFMEGLNQEARDFWARQSASVTSRPIGDTSAATTVVRDELAAAARARHPRERMEALNRAARAFWARA